MEMINSEKFNIATSLVDIHVQNGLGNKLAIVDQHDSLTYAELLTAVLNFSKITELAVLKTGSIVACVFEDSLHSAVAFLGLIRMGLVPCFINPGMPQCEYANYFSDCDAIFALTNSAHVDKISQAISVINLSYYLINSVDELIVNKAPMNSNSAKVDDHSPAFCLFTSGTTGRPSAVVHRHKDVVIMNQHYASEVLRVSEQDVLFSTSKLFFAYGLNNLLIALYHGATAILSPEKLNAPEIREILFERKVTLFFSVPAMYSRLLAFDEIDLEFVYLRLCVSAGEHLPQKIYQTWLQRFGLALIDGIGTTEILSTFISNREHEIQEGSTGKAVKGFLLEIRDEEGHVVKCGQPGVLWVKGDTYLCQYLKNHNATKERFVNGWFKTYDIFSKDQKGFFYYHGRASDLVKCGGVWIYPYRMENVLCEYPAVFECAVVAEKQENDLLRPAAYIVLKENYKPSDDLVIQIKEFCKQNGSPFEYPHFIYFISELPRTYSGKVKRFSLVKNTHNKEGIC